MKNELINLLNDSFAKQYEKRGLLTAHHTAEDLIANGVIIQKWIPVEERLPENGDDVLCWYEYFRYGEHNCMFQKHGIGFCINGNWGGEVMVGTDCRVIAWMPLPSADGLG